MFNDDFDVVVLQEVVTRQDGAIRNAHLQQSLIQILPCVVVGV
jgi:hypothetical protein